MSNNKKGKNNDEEFYLRKLINTLVISIFSFFIILKTTKIELHIIQYIILVFISWYMIKKNFDRKKSTEFFIYSIIVTIGSFLAYLVVSVDEVKAIKEIIIKIIEKIKIIKEIKKLETDQIIVIVIFIVLMLTLKKLKYISNHSCKNNVENKPLKLVKSREKDLESIKKYLKQFDIVGINANWGMGKSFLVEVLKNDLKDEYEIIEIDLLTCNIDDILSTLIKDIEKIMFKNGIMSKYSRALNQFISENKKLKDFIGFSHQSTYNYSQTIKGLKEELQNLDLKILIIYEDIDRISDGSVIKKIFALSEKLSCENIKIIYQYDENKLAEVDKAFTYEYLEKYIPHNVKLTEIGFLETIEFVIEDKNLLLKNTTIEDFEFLTDINYSNRYENYSYQSYYKRKIQLVEYTGLMPDKFSIRKVENFLKELKVVIDKLSINDEEYIRLKKTIIALIYLKHFKPEIYGKINISESPIETFKIEFENKLYTLYEIKHLVIFDKACKYLSEHEYKTLRDIEYDFRHKGGIKGILVDNGIENEKVDEICAEVGQYLGKHNGMGYFNLSDEIYSNIIKKNEENIISLNVLNFLGYKISGMHIIDIIQKGKFSEFGISQIFLNKKIDRLIWNMIYSGKSKNTKHEKLMHKLDGILDDTKDEWDKHRSMLQKYLNINSYGVDRNICLNLTIDELFIELSKLFKLNKDYCRNQVKFFEFYLEISKSEHKEDETVSKILYNFCNLSNEDYKNLITIFNRLEIRTTKASKIDIYRNIYTGGKISRRKVSINNAIRDFTEKYFYIYSIEFIKNKAYFNRNADEECRNAIDDWLKPIEKNNTISYENFNPKETIENIEFIKNKLESMQNTGLNNEEKSELEELIKFLNKMIEMSNRHL